MKEIDEPLCLCPRRRRDRRHVRRRRSNGSFTAHKREMHCCVQEWDFRFSVGVVVLESR